MSDDMSDTLSASQYVRDIKIKSSKIRRAGPYSQDIGFRG